jgi:hypothetical protein
VGQMHLVIDGSPRPFDTVSFYCNKDGGHRDECAFIGVELIVTRRRREDGGNFRTLPQSSR